MDQIFCRLCDKILKDFRTFRNHKARHMGALNHKCPGCQCFEGRSAVNRHLITNHGRELQPHEITNNSAATPGFNTIKPSAPEKSCLNLQTWLGKHLGPMKFPPSHWFLCMLWKLQLLSHLTPKS